MGRVPDTVGAFTVRVHVRDSSSSRLAVFCGVYGLGLPRSALPVAKGTYDWFSGLTYKTCGEGDAAGFCWNDCRGIGTVPETVAVRDEGVGVLGLSLVTTHQYGRWCWVRLCAVGA